jgi:hypothetical protein
VLEAQELKRLWPLSVLAPFDGCKTPKDGPIPISRSAKPFCQGEADAWRPHAIAHEHKDDTAAALS